MAFFLLILIWTIFWLGWNLLAPPNMQFDPPMGFVFWLFISNLIQIMLMRHRERQNDMVVAMLEKQGVKLDEVLQQARDAG
jgi:hypothetical protein